MFVLPFTRAARKRKETKQILSAATIFILSYEDIVEKIFDAGRRAAFDELREARAACDVTRCKELLAELDEPKSCALGREWLDILVVSISVAMAFRAYFYEPFNIPTGSMQPTLYGNYSVACSPAKATFWDKGPQKWLKWALTGADYKCFRAPFNGVLVFGETNTGRYDMRVIGPGGIKSDAMYIPTDVLHASDTGDGPVRASRALPNGLTQGSSVLKGQLLWSGYSITGDFLFVNRWLWNFRHPQRGDVMIFSTTGIANLQQGTHYIKRMTGVPNETLSIKDGHLWVDGKMPMAPRRIAQIQNHEKCRESAYPYAGYRAHEYEPYNVPGKTICHNGDEVKLGADEYYACGDNSPSSYDSRYWGSVPARNLRGIAGGVFWPFINTRWGVIE